MYLTIDSSKVQMNVGNVNLSQAVLQEKTPETSLPWIRRTSILKRSTMVQPAMERCFPDTLS